MLKLYLKLSLTSFNNKQCRDKPQRHHHLKMNTLYVLPTGRSYTCNIRSHYSHKTYLFQVVENTYLVTWRKKQMYDKKTLVRRTAVIRM